MAYLAEYWEDTCTPAERAAWNLYATNVAMKNKLGETIKLTGHNHFMRSNSVRQFQHLGVIAAGPTLFELPAKDSMFTFDADASPQRITFTFQWGEDWLAETGAFAMIRQGVPQNGTRNFFGGPYRNLGVVLGSGSPWDAPIPFTPVFALATGQRLWCACRISRADGRLSEIFYYNALVHSQKIGEVPNLVGMTEAQAVAALTAPNVQLILGSVTTENSETVPVGIIISSDPVAHTYLSAGDPVNILVSLGPVV
ncbi:hypothetical protein ES703_63249 [subsurface metagenome]